ncbi:MAG: insulinase family protein [Calditrichaeota bacterium]|nr:MAG: insulinase family protein [Calditrichota bacterium]
MMTHIPRSQPPRPFNFPHFQTFKLSNGLEVWYARHSKLPLISARLVLFNAALEEPAGKEGIASFTADMLDEGAGPYDAAAFSMKLENSGIHFHPHADFDAAHISLNTLTEFAGQAFTLLKDAVSAPRFALEDVERVRALRVAHIMQQADQAEYIAWRFLTGSLYNGHRYALSAMGRLTHNQALKQSDLVAYHRRIYQPSHAILVVVGDPEDDRIRDILEETLGQWPNHTTRLFESTPFTKQPPQRLFIHKPGAQQTEILLGHYGIDRLDKDYLPTLLANQVLGGYFLSRLNMNLREDKGYTYGIESRFNVRRLPGPFYISASVQTDKTEQALFEIEKEIRGLLEKPVTEEELEQARGYLNGVFPIAFESGAQIASGLSNIALFKLPDDYYRTFRASLARVTPEQVHRAARTHIRPEDLHVVVVGDQKSMSAAFLKTFDKIETDARLV